MAFHGDIFTAPGLSLCLSSKTCILNIIYIELLDVSDVVVFNRHASILEGIIINDISLV